MSQHLSDALFNSFADEELSPAEAAELASHLAGCPACTTSALSQMMLKSAVARAGRRYELPAAMRGRLPLNGRFPRREAKDSAKKSPVWVGWSAAVAAILLVAAGMGVIERGVIERRATEKAEEAALVTEITDQHVSAMAVGAPPEVLSSDRHTVKPWFQGKIPFSFNLPDGLPGDTTLDGANLAYMGHRPVAQLLYSIGKHRVSVFLSETASENDLLAEQSGFHVRASHAGPLEIVAVSDVEPVRLEALVAMIRGAQTR